MAVPAISNNSPSNGSIAWAAFSIQYSGTSFQIAAGSTAQRWVWWRYNGGAATIEAGADVPSDLGDDDLVLFANKNGVGVRVQSSSFVDGELLVDGSIFADALSTNLVQTKHITTVGLDAAVIKFGIMSGDRIEVNTLVGDRLAANTVSASKLDVTTIADNVALNGRFDELRPDDNTMPLYFARGGWNSDASNTAAAVSVDTTAANVETGTRSVKLTSQSAAPGRDPSFRTDTAVPVTPGEVWNIAGRVKASEAINGVYIRLMNQNGTEVNQSIENRAVGTAWTTLGGQFTIPAGMTSMRVFVLKHQSTVGSSLWVNELSVRKVGVSVRIADGTVNANKIVANSVNTGHVTTTGLDAGVIKFGTMSGDRITANTINTGHVVTGGLSAGVITFGQMSGDRIVANTINSNHVVTTGLDASIIKFGTMHGDRIQANTITAAKLSGDAIDGKTITGATIQTALSGQRVTFDLDGLEAFNSSGSIVTMIAAATGALTSANAHFSSSTNATTGSGNTPALRVGSLNGRHLRIDGNELLGMNNDSTQGELYLNTGGTTRVGNMNLSGMFFSPATFNNAIVGTASALTLRTIDGAGTTTGQIQVAGVPYGQAKLISNQVGLMFLGQRLGVVKPAMGESDFNSGNVLSFVCNQMTTFNGVFDNSYVRGGSNNVAVYITPGGKFGATTSSRRYKQDISALSLDDVKPVLNIESVRYRRKETVEYLGEDVASFEPGFIAEQAHKAKADLWVNYDAIGRPESFKYAEMSVAHNMMIKDLYEQNAKLVERLAALESAQAA